MSDSETDTDAHFIIVSDTDEYSDDDTEKVDRKPKEDDETVVEREKIVSVPNKDKNQNTILKTSSANAQTKCNICKRVYSSSNNLKRHKMAMHRPIYTKEQKEKIKSAHNSERLRRKHNNFNGSRGHKSTPKIGVRKSIRVTAQVIKTEATTVEASAAICENHQITCELCKHRIILPKGIQLAHGQCINSTPKCTSTDVNGNHSDRGQSKINPKSIARSTKNLTPRLKITKKEMQCCPACKIQFPNDRFATAHYWRVHKRHVLACKYCDNYLSSPQKLNNHIDVFHA